MLTHVCEMRVHSKNMAPTAMIIMEGPQSHQTSAAADDPLCKIRENKQLHVLSYCAAPQQLWIIYSYAKCAQISELEPIITVRRPHRQRMSSAANALLCNIGEGKQCNRLSYF